MQHQPEIPAARYQGPTTRSMRKASSSATRQQSTPPNTRVSLRSLNASHAHHQYQSPLWGKLPAEIRNQIFDLAVSQHLDLEREYAVGSYYRRPGYTHAFKVCTALLQTCRLAWLESHSIPMRSATINIWEAIERGPPEEMRSYNPRIMEWHQSPTPNLLTPANVRDLEHVQFFAQLYWLEPGCANPLFERPFFRPRRITITIRHTDWWWWEDDEDLNLQELTLRLPPSTEQLVIEFETIVRKKPQLDPIVAHYRDKTFTRADNTVLSVVEEPTEWCWSSELGDYGLQNYVVVVVTWKSPQTRK